MRYSFFLASFLIFLSTTTQALHITSGDPQYWRATVADLRVRDKPNTQGKVIGKLALGESVRSANERTDTKSDVELRGMQMTDYWYKVKLSDNTTGWVFGGAIRQAPAGGTKDDAKVQALLVYLSTVGFTDIDNYKKTLDYVKTKLAGASPEAYEEVCLPVMTIGYQVANNVYEMLPESVSLTAEEETRIGDEINARSEGRGVVDMNINPAAAKLGKAGFTYIQVEGSFQAILDEDLLDSYFEKQGTPALKTYLALQKVDSYHPNQDDGGMTISVRAYADRGVKWEQFVKANPGSALYADALNSYDSYVSGLMLGMDNTPVFSSEDDKKITDDFKSGYEYVVKTYPDTDLGKEIAAYLNVLKANGYKRTKAVQDFLKAKFPWYNETE